MFFAACYGDLPGSADAMLPGWLAYCYYELFMFLIIEFLGWKFRINKKSNWIISESSFDLSQNLNRNHKPRLYLEFLAKSDTI